MSVAVLKHGAEEGEVRDQPNLVERRSEEELTGDWDRWWCRCTIRPKTMGSGTRERTHGTRKSTGGSILLRRASTCARKGGERWGVPAVHFGLSRENNGREVLA
jgi:hypothetical protein